MNLYVRIDDRLIHGQIATAWCSFLNIERIIGIDDKTASNAMLKQIMKMGAPSSVECEVVTKEEAKKLLKEESSKTTLVVMRFPEDLAAFYEELKGAKQIVVGNVSKKDDSIIAMNLGVSVFHLTQNDCDVLKECVAQGHNVIFKTVPNSNEVSWENFIKDYAK